MAGMTQVAKSLWTPDGMHDLRQKDVIPVSNPRHRMALVWMHEFAHEHGLSLVCKRCDSAITGQNNDSPDTKHYSVACRCREFRLVR